MPKEENKTILSWVAPEFIYREKTRTWFALLVIISITIFIISLLMKNYLFAFIVPIAFFLLYVYAKKRPRSITVKITEEGININELSFLPYNEIVSFWLFEEPENTSLSLETKKIFQPKISLLLGDQPPEEIRKILLKFVEERKHEEELIEVIARRLNF